MSSSIPSVSVLLDCRASGEGLLNSVASVLQQPECLEILVANYWLSTNQRCYLEDLSEVDSRVRILQGSQVMRADALNHAVRLARGTLIYWLDANDISTSGSLARAVHAMDTHPEWLMVYGEGEEFNSDSGLKQRYPTLLPSVGVEGFRTHCFICQPTVVFRRCMTVLLGPFASQLKNELCFDYWLRAFDAFPQRIGYIPHLQGSMRLPDDAITKKELIPTLFESLKLLSRYFGTAPISRLHNLGLELQLAAEVDSSGESQASLFCELIDLLALLFDPNELEALRRDWKICPDDMYQYSELEFLSRIPLPRNSLAYRLLQVRHPQLSPEVPASPSERESIWRKVLVERCNDYRLVHSHENEYKAAKSMPDQFRLAKKNRPFGVNLIGHAFEVFGIGEDVRMAARALKAANIPFCVVHHPADNGAPCTDRSLDPWLCKDPDGGPYAFNLICLTAPIQARWILQTGLDANTQPYTIASWPWETRKWPDSWLPLFEIVDEVWPSSTFTAEALQDHANHLNIPVKIMSMAVEITEPDKYCSKSSCSTTRQRLGISEQVVLFGYCFDIKSTATRKNPMATLEAFQQAFPLPYLSACKGRESTSHPLSQDVALLIKTFPPRKSCPEWEWLQLRAKEDPRIHLIEASLERDELLAIFAACDVFLSLHRSEGFGRAIAEVLQLGVDVIATDYGGNTDFCSGPLSHLVRCKEIPIPSRAYPHAEGQFWGDPDLDHAVELMHEVAARRFDFLHNPDYAAYDVSSDPSVLSLYREYFSPSVVGKRYKKRLNELWSQW